MGRLIDAEIAEKRIASLVELIDEICKDVRERHGSDDVCGLCEYDGSTLGESGDWYPECPGFETDECFCMKESFKQKYLERIPTIELYGTWIPVSSRKLPKEHLESVIGWDEYRNRCVFVRYDGREWILGDHESVKIIAWMPLPEPYREEK